MSDALHLPRLRPDQSRIATHPAKVKVISMGRRWGKTTMAGAIALAAANDGVPMFTIVKDNGLDQWTIVLVRGSEILERLNAGLDLVFLQFGVVLYNVMVCI